MRPRHLGIQFHGALQVFGRSHQVVAEQLTLTQEKRGFRRLPVAQDAVQQRLRLLGAVVFQQRHA